MTNDLKAPNHELEEITGQTRQQDQQLNFFELAEQNKNEPASNESEDTMTINLQMPDITELKPKITVFGVGGAGGNAVNNMIKSGLEGVEFVVANTDAQALTSSRSEKVVQMGLLVTEGLGAGSQPEVGKQAAEEVLDEINDYLDGSHMAFITAGMGGGTGTGAAPVVARAARERGILTVGVVTKPFQFEGARRMRLADRGIEELQANVDTLIVIPNQNLFRIANEKTTFADAFSMADQVLYSGVACITDLMVKEGLINLDFADVRSVMQEMGKAMMGTGEASGDQRAVEAAEAAIANPLLDETTMRGAQGLLISITGGNDLTLFEVDEAATRIREEVDPDANIILGATFDEALEGIVRVSVVATGIENAAGQGVIPAPKAASTFMRPIVEKTVPASAEISYEMEAEMSVRETSAATAHNEAVVREDMAPVAPVAAKIMPEAAPVVTRQAKTDPAVTITPFTPSVEAMQLAQNTMDMPAVEGFDQPVSPRVMDEQPMPSGPFIPPLAEEPMLHHKMPSVDDFPMIIQEEIRAKSGVGHGMAGNEERGALNLLKRITTATLGSRRDESSGESVKMDVPVMPEVQAAPPQAPQQVAPLAAASPAVPSAPAMVAPRMQPAQPQETNAFAKPAQPVQTPQPRAQSEQYAAAYAPAQGNLDQQGRAVPTQHNQLPEDAMEIPAFLRRQG